MKTPVSSLSKLAGLLGLALISAAYVHAEEPKVEKPVSAANLAKYDKDGDGALNDAEKAAMSADKKAAWAATLAKYDKDGDGKLSDEEKVAMRADKKKQAPAE
jgi:hypothetical protein